MNRLNKLFLAGCMAAFVISTLASANAQGQLKVGDKAPDFELASLDGKTVKLSERFGAEGKTTVLLFSRANW